jgi:hypothetical protein
MSRVYGDPDLAKSSKRALRDLKMTSTVAQYIGEFQRHRQYVKYNEDALHEQFLHGLTERIKDDLAIQGDPDELSLFELQQAASKLDIRHQERRLDKKSSNFQKSLAMSRNHSNTSTGTIPPTPSCTPSPAVNQPNTDGTIPMDLGATRPNFPLKLNAEGKITNAEREHRRINGLCNYCGEEGHMAWDCPNSPQNRSQNRRPSRPRFQETQIEFTVTKPKNTRDEE